MEQIDRFLVKLYDYKISTNQRSEVIYCNDPNECLDYVDQAVEGILKEFGKRQFDRVVVYDRIQKRNLLDYETDRGVRRASSMNVAS